MIIKTTDRYVGLTIDELATNLPADPNNGYCVFEIEHDDDKVGKMIGESYSLYQILKENEQLRGAVVVMDNDFFGETVLRVRRRSSE